MIVQSLVWFVPPSSCRRSPVDMHLAATAWLAGVNRKFFFSSQGRS